MYPVNISAFNTSSTSLYVEWSPLDPQLIAGILRKYRVVYSEYSVYNLSIAVFSSFIDIEISHHLVRRAVEPRPLLSVELKHLKPFRNYSIVIEGATKFHGEPSPAIMVQTDEDGE